MGPAEAQGRVGRPRGGGGAGVHKQEAHAVRKGVAESEMEENGFNFASFLGVIVFPTDINKNFNFIYIYGFSQCLFKKRDIGFS